MGPGFPACGPGFEWVQPARRPATSLGERQRDFRGAAPARSSCPSPPIRSADALAMGNRTPRRIGVSRLECLPDAASWAFTGRGWLRSPVASFQTPKRQRSGAATIAGCDGQGVLTVATVGKAGLRGESDPPSSVRRSKSEARPRATNSTLKPNQRNRLNSNQELPYSDIGGPRGEVLCQCATAPGYLVGGCAVLLHF